MVFCLLVFVGAVVVVCGGLWWWSDWFSCWNFYTWSASFPIFQLLEFHKVGIWSEAVKLSTLLYIERFFYWSFIY